MRGLLYYACNGWRAGELLLCNYSLKTVTESQVLKQVREQLWNKIRKIRLKDEELLSRVFITSAKWKLELYNEKRRVESLISTFLQYCNEF